MTKNMRARVYAQRKMVAEAQRAFFASHNPAKAIHEKVFANHLLKSPPFDQRTISYCSYQNILTWEPVDDEFAPVDDGFSPLDFYMHESDPGIVIGEPQGANGIKAYEIVGSEGEFFIPCGEEEIEDDIPVSAVAKPRPPLNAELLLHLFLKRGERDGIIGDLIEDYLRKHERLGRWRADLWFCCEVTRSLWPLAKRLLVKLGGIAGLTALVRRLF